MAHRPQGRAARRLLSRVGLAVWCSCNPFLSETAFSGPPEGVSTTDIHAYCEDFAVQYAQNTRVEYAGGSARVTRYSDLGRILSNFFQPPGSRFEAGYRCRFRTRPPSQQTIEVDIYLTETLEFARYTRWERVQIIPIAYVVDRHARLAGYGVFKYLHTP